MVSILTPGICSSVCSRKRASVSSAFVHFVLGGCGNSVESGGGLRPGGPLGFLAVAQTYLVISFGSFCWLKSGPEMRLKGFCVFILSEVRHKVHMLKGNLE